MQFINECDAIFNQDDLEAAIINKCSETNKSVKETYRITCREGYPCICIAHEHYRLHSLLGRYYYGECEVVHHKDHNKLNASRNNLVPLTMREHSKEHNLVQFVPKEHLQGFGKRMAPIKRRNDVTEENVRALRNQGLTINQIAEELNCGINTVNRRLGMKD